MYDLKIILLILNMVLKYYIFIQIIFISWDVENRIQINRNKKKNNNNNN